MECFNQVEVVDFLSSSDPFNFEHLLLSYAEENAIYLSRDFRPIVENSYYLCNFFRKVRDRVKHRLNMRDCACTDPDKMSFSDLLIKTFENKTLYSLLDGDLLEMDYFYMEIFRHHAGFDAREVLNAYHNVKKLKRQLYNVRDKLVINVFASDSE